ncbi:nitric oxide dioxygenase [Bacillus ectoiniformans]|uniref:NO-inducible flavohemoprotein n=1 Tax=Bacillus ectoiniformans TaxID=1494429 RepID=UPI00195EFF5D|nr:NO-inducible flavohemoprotein [Bacillus ectoiniformans]MBM7649520.1 nitric oxide dioxygenase [Bacillus ectoiniformans]
MLSQKTIDIVKSTAPVLEVHGTAITTHFYRTMFEAHPELLNIFNHANQKQGRQQTALANTVYAAAKYIDQLEVLIPAVKQIGHKHRSLAIKAEHYPIVGEYLLKAIKEVLGDAATDDIINAWGEAYGAIAQVFIDVEAEMYKEASEQDGGWMDFKEFEVAEKKEESSLITSFYLKPKDGVKLPAYLPGQYITVKLSIPGEEHIVNRQYSLSAAPNEEFYRISVKREADHQPEGKVSNYLHDHIQAGDVVEVSAPAGDFYLETNQSAPVTLISGGVGVTPMMSMLHTLASEGTSRNVTFIHAARDEQAHAFKDEVQQLVSQLENGRSYIAYENAGEQAMCDVKGYISKEFLAGAVDNDSICFVCGPVPFMEAAISHLKSNGISDENIRYEFFGPAVALQA